MVEITFSATKAANGEGNDYAVGDEVRGVVCVIDGDYHAARVRVTEIVSRETVERPEWMGAPRVPARGADLHYPILRTTYRAEVIHSRVTRIPAASDALSTHLENLGSN
jgi:hypothetical protein